MTAHETPPRGHTLTEAQIEECSPVPAKGGAAIRAYCPIHGSDKQRSLELNPDTGRFACYACGAWGYTREARERFRRERSSRDARAGAGEARMQQADPPRTHHTPVPSSRSHATVAAGFSSEQLEQLVRRFQQSLPGSAGESYLRSRGIPLEFALRHRLGYCPLGLWPGANGNCMGGRITVPHTAPDGRLLNIYGRAVPLFACDDHGERHRHLPGPKGYFNAPALMHGEGPVALVEGPLDALSLMIAGHVRTVATFGVSDVRWRWLQRVEELLIAPDSDAAGDDWRELPRQASLLGIRVACLPRDPWRGHKDANAALVAGALDAASWRGVALDPATRVEWPREEQPGDVAPAPSVSGVTGSKAMSITTATAANGNQRQTPQPRESPPAATRRARNSTKLCAPRTEPVLVRDLHHARDVLDECRRTGVCWFDAETSGFDPFEDWIVSYQVSPRPGISFYFPLAHENFAENLDVEISMAMMADLFRIDHVLFGGHNIKFDLQWWMRLGYRTPRPFVPGRKGGYRDTMVEAFLMNENQPSFELKDLVAQHLGVRMLKFSELGIARNRTAPKAGQLPHFGCLSVEQAMRYACPDTDYSLQLDALWYPEIENARYRHVFHYIDNPLVEILARMELRGMAVDRNYLKTLVGPLTKRVDGHTAELRRIAEEAGFKNPVRRNGVAARFNPASPDQVRGVVQLLGIRTGKFTKGGKGGKRKIAVDKEVIRKLAPRHPFLGALGALRDDEKTLGTYVLAMLGLEWNRNVQDYDERRGHVNPVTGRIHTSFNQTVAKTGRLSSSDPNLQNIPKKSGSVIRKAFVPAPGSVFVRMDYKQIELKILAHISNCRPMIEAFQAGKDLHSIAAIKAYHLNDVDLEGPYVYGDGIKAHPNTDYKKLRDKAKAVNFGIVYGISNKGLSIQLECSKEEAQRLIDAWFVAFPEIGEWLSGITRHGRKHGFVETMLCRTRRFTPPYSLTEAEK